MMTETKFPAKLLESCVIEIFGSSEHKGALLLKPLSQRTKFHLRKLGEQLNKEQVLIKKQLQELHKEYATEDFVDEATQKEHKRIPEDKREEFIAKARELEELEIPLMHYDFQEKDFVDGSTNDIVAGDIYYNIIDLLIFNKQ